MKGWESKLNSYWENHDQWIYRYIRYQCGDLEDPTRAHRVATVKALADNLEPVAPKKERK